MTGSDDPRADMRIEQLALGALQQSGVEALTEQEQSMFLLQVILHATMRLLSLRGRSWTCGMLDVLRAKALEDESGRAGPLKQ
jgi:hypothetical protein